MSAGGVASGAGAVSVVALSPPPPHALSMSAATRAPRANLIFISIPRKDLES